MIMSLFNTIHTTNTRNPRTTPVSLEEFVNFGLLPEDYAVYVGLQHQLQTTMILGELFLPTHTYIKERTSCEDDRIKHLAEIASFGLRD